MSASKVLLVLGAGGRVGASVAKLFGQNGYKVAIAARSLEDKTNDQGQLQVRVDVGSPDSINATFDKVSAQFGPPSVVVHNAASMHAVPADNPLAISFDDLQQDFAVNTAGVVVAAKRAVEGFAQLPDGASKTFIYTGNFLNEQIMPALFSGGIGKSATAHVMHVASNAYADKGYQ